MAFPQSGERGAEMADLLGLIGDEQRGDAGVCSVGGLEGC